MTVGGTVETCEKGGGRGVGDGGNEVAELLQSFTTLSTIAIQAGQSQITISVLKVGGEKQKVGSMVSMRTFCENCHSTCPAAVYSRNIHCRSSAGWWRRRLGRT